MRFKWTEVISSIFDESLFASEFTVNFAYTFDAEKPNLLQICFKMHEASSKTLRPIQKDKEKGAGAVLSQMIDKFSNF